MSEQAATPAPKRRWFRWSIWSIVMLGALVGGALVRQSLRHKTYRSWNDQVRQGRMTEDGIREDLGDEYQDYRRYIDQRPPNRP